MICYNVCTTRGDFSLSRARLMTVPAAVPEFPVGHACPAPAAGIGLLFARLTRHSPLVTRHCSSIPAAVPQFPVGHPCPAPAAGIGLLFARLTRHSPLVTRHCSSIPAALLQTPVSRSSFDFQPSTVCPELRRVDPRSVNPLSSVPSALFFKSPYPSHFIGFTLPVFSYTYALLCHSQNPISCLFTRLRTLCTKTPGGWCPRCPPRLRTLQPFSLRTFRPAPV